MKTNHKLLSSIKNLSVISIFLLGLVFPPHISFSLNVPAKDTVTVSDFVRLAPEDLITANAILALRKTIEYYNNNDMGNYLKMFSPKFRDSRGFRFSDVPLSARTDQTLFSQIRIVITSINNVIIDRSDLIRASVVFDFKVTVTDRDTESTILFDGTNTMVFEFGPKDGVTKVASLPIKFSLFNQAYADQSQASQQRRAVRDESLSQFGIVKDEGQELGDNQISLARRPESTTGTTSTSATSTDKADVERRPQPRGLDETDEALLSKFFLQGLDVKVTDHTFTPGMDNPVVNYTNEVDATGDPQAVFLNAKVMNLTDGGFQDNVTAVVSEGQPGAGQGFLDRIIRDFFFTPGVSISYDPILGIKLGNFDTELNQINGDQITFTANQGTQSFDAGSTGLDISQISTSNTPAGRNVSASTVTIQPNNLFIQKNTQRNFSIFMKFKFRNGVPVADIKVQNNAN